MTESPSSPSRAEDKNGALLKKNLKIFLFAPLSIVRFMKEMQIRMIRQDREIQFYDKIRQSVNNADATSRGM